MNVFEEIKKYIKRKTNKDVTLESSFRELGIDSLDLLDFIVDLEKQMNIKISDEELVTITTVQDIVTAIEKKR